MMTDHLPCGSEVTIDIEASASKDEIRGKLEAATGVPAAQQKVMLSSIGQIVMGDKRWVIGVGWGMQTLALVVGLVATGGRNAGFPRAPHAGPTSGTAPAAAPTACKWPAQPRSDWVLLTLIGWGRLRMSALRRKVVTYM